MKNFISLLSITRKYKKQYFLGVIFIILVDILQLIYPVVLARLTDLLRSGKLSMKTLTIYSCLILLIGFLIFILRFLWRYLVKKSARKVEMDIRNEFYANLTTQDAEFYNKNTTGDLMSHVTNDINNISAALGQGVAFLFDSTFIPVFAIIMLIAIGGIKFSMITLIPLVFLAITIFFMSKIMHNRILKMQESFSNLTEFVRETIAGIRVIKVFAQEKQQISRFAIENKQNKNRNIRYLTLTSMLFPIVMSISAFSYAIIIWYGGKLVIAGEISLGDFVAYNSYVGLLTWPIATFGWMINMFQRGIVSKNRVDRILEVTSKISDAQCDNKIEKIHGDIEFSGVSFRYPENNLDALKNIDFKLKKGQTLGIIGRTGSGKTTIVNLLMRLYDIEKGQILIDGTPIDKFPFKVLRSYMALVPQDSFLFSETIKSNIGFFSDFSQDEIEKYAKYAQIYEDIKDFPEGFDTFIGEKGVTLSGGQKQRVSIARTLIFNANILIFDDCLSAVDTKTEEAILSEFDKNLKGKTKIIISNRISAIKNTDLIIALKDGEICEYGKHEDLVNEKGYYFELYCLAEARK